MCCLALVLRVFWGHFSILMGTFTLNEIPLHPSLGLFQVTYSERLQSPNVWISAFLDLVPLSNSSDFRQCLKSKQKGSNFRHSVWPLYVLGPNGTNSSGFRHCLKSNHFSSDFRHCLKLERFSSVWAIRNI